MSQPTSTRAERAANLFDLRRIIGGVFVVWGILLIVLGATDSTAEANKAAGININLSAGIGMLVVGIVFVTWALTRPLGTELREAEADGSEQAGRGTRRDRERPGGSGEPGSQ
jgi:hypothetical protein